LIILAVGFILSSHSFAFIAQILRLQVVLYDFVNGWIKKPTDEEYKEIGHEGVEEETE